MSDNDPVSTESSPPLPPRRLGLFAGLAVVVLALDIVTKFWAVATLDGQEPVRLFGGALYLVLVRNPGAAWSIGADYTWVLSLIMAAVVLAILYFAPRLRSGGWAAGLGLVLAGALGNLGDRLFRPPGFLHGHVVDFLSLFAPDGSVWPVFNVADSAICVGGGLIVLMALLGREYDGTVIEKKPRASKKGTSS
ncbi:signal peptidase II [Allokutzneria albata]|uniref:Lipoprotein signal peptidase n=1 Tax=Allokutzneria albata TaxID=211114 RepID=A0A1G9X116_ALLAB|nr:signal peptidase II [Allokutzneria albata]SDM90407.1 signal peptidase II [Allokutzneria albata]